MDLINIWESISARSPMFLAATGSVALGITLIFTAGIVQLKRLRARSRHVPRLEKPKPAIAVEIIPLAEEFIAKSAENPELLHLLRRLRTASDKLEKMRTRDVPDSIYPADSPLKRSPSGVDYIFRAGTG